MLITRFREKKKNICIPITFNNQLKVCFSNKKCPITIQTRPTQLVCGNIFLIEKPVLTEFFRLLVQKIKYLSLFQI